jgi:uncharacterized OB-fold protein
MSTTLTRAVPGDHIRIATDPWTEPFWQAAKVERLVAPCCGHCGKFRMPPTPFCPNCQSQNTRWVALPGTGSVYSFAICTRSPFPDVPDFVYAPVVVDLDEAAGIRLVSNILDVAPDDIHIGMRVMVDWSPITDGWKLPVFRRLT